MDYSNIPWYLGLPLAFVLTIVWFGMALNWPQKIRNVVDDFAAQRRHNRRMRNLKRYAQMDIRMQKDGLYATARARR